MDYTQLNTEALPSVKGMLANVEGDNNMDNNKTDQARRTVELIDLKEYFFPKGFKVITKVETWVDGKVKDELEEEEYKDRQPKHIAKYEFDLSSVCLHDFVHKMLMTSSSPRVTKQNAERKRFDSDEALEAGYAIENTVKIDMSAAIKGRSKLSDLDKAKRESMKVSDKDDLEALKAAVEAQIAALEGAK